ncbi:acyl transferase domain-containing protein [Aspergillus cavernicola]|uniref:Acyl transferase domain-containing protein n=1 Tax=Aspergillus cavernicola TaxID=176166 RepID=A0ABR4HVV8_9EURO
MIPHNPDKTSGILDAVDAGRLRLYACCGGQGSSNLTALDELVHLSHTYEDCSPLQHLLASAARRLEALSASPHHSSFFSGRGFPLQYWLNGSAPSAPSNDELALSPYSFPINTLLSLTNYALTAHRLHLDPTQLRGRLKGVIGHSQGVFAAAAIAQAGVGWPAFYHAADLALQLSFWVGLESHSAAPGSTLSAEEVADCIEHEEGSPSHLLSVAGLKAVDLTRLIRKLDRNREQDEDEELDVHLSLVNSRNKCVLAGTPQGLRRVCLALRTIRAPPTLDQSRISFNKRRPVIDVQFLPVSAPYHSSLLQTVELWVIDATTDLRLTGDTLAVPIYCAVDGKIENLQLRGAEDIRSTLIRAVTVEQVDWPTICRQMDGATHVLSLGPGSVGNLVQDVVEGTGIRVLHLSGRSLPSSLSSLALPKFPVPDRKHWGRQYRPRLRNASLRQAAPYIQTKMTRLLGTPPIMVAGMTPTTCSPDLVAAVMQAGYHVEFACGGYHKPAQMETALRRLAATIPVHRAITCNVIYASPKSLSWQIDLLRDLNEEGLPIEGLTVGAGIPSPEVVRDWTHSLGLSHIWFKPGSLDAIDRVLAIARQHPAFSIGLQWTGGRAGGHHSFEDFHQPILDRYGRIRELDNIVLVAGSGFGGAEDTWPYLTGSWSERLGFPAMPFDGVLLGSRMMVAREAKTSLSAKKLIVEASGIDDDNGAWTRTENEAVGGVLSVISEMGQPIHVLATRAMRLWHEFDRRFFSIRDREHLQTLLRQHRDEIISRLNQDYARPWFAVTDYGQPIQIEDMSYSQVLRRLCRFMYVSHQDRWIDPTYLTLVHDFLRMAQARFSHRIPLGDDPVELQMTFDATFGQADELLYPEDVALLLALFRRQGQKPVPFVPRLDADFETWFKKDSLWQSEDIEAVPDQDPQRVCIIQGPVAVRHSTTCDESAGQILDRIRDGHVEMLGHQSSIDEEDELTSNILHGDVKLPGVHVTKQGSLYRYHLVGPTLPSPQAVVEHLVGDCAWAQAALMNKSIILGHTRVRNPIHDAFKPEMGNIIDVRVDGEPCEITLYTTTTNHGDVQQIGAALELTYHDNGEITMTLLGCSSNRAQNVRPSLELTFEMIGGPMVSGLLQVSQDDYLECVQSMYTRLWIGNRRTSPSSAGLNSEFTGNAVTITEDAVKAFLAVVRQTGPPVGRAWDAQGPIVPLDYTVVLAWTVLTKPLLLPNLEGDPLQLLHQSISMRVIPGARPLHVGDVVRTSSRITERTITTTGQRIEVSADIHRGAELVVQVRSVFIIQRRPQTVAQQQFRSVEEPDMIMHVNSPVQLQVLASRKWLLLDGQSLDLLGKTVVFRLNTQTIYDISGAPSTLQVAGSVSLLPDHTSPMASLGTKVGRVYLEEDGCRVNPVLDFLNRHGTPRVQRQMLQNPGWAGDGIVPFTAPSQSDTYASVSQDTNPIHLCQSFARFAGRAQPVVHGMHLSATVRRILEWMVGDTQRSRFRTWTASFDEIVRTHDRLRMEVQHKAMEEGLMVVHVTVVNELTGLQVMHTEATIEQPRTSYVFTGQGTQEKGMGMALYGTRKAAQAVWDRAERYFESQYGLSLLHIVRDNPTSLTVHFGGRRGREIRGNYLAMSSRSDADKSMLPGLTNTSRSYTFSYQTGLLMSTQFAQPALAVMEMAEYAHLQAQGIVQSPALFAGHSLGEYSALGACTTFMPFESLLSLILYRGLKMQNALPRDSNGRTDYAMMAADPSRVYPGFGESDLMELVQLIGHETGLLLEVVNHNVRSRQYVCAGHIRSLWVMGQVCDELSQSTFTASLKDSIHQHVLKAQSITNQTQLTRGRATIPLAGVDIPFHSKMLRGHIDDYRQHLRRHLRISDLKPEEFVGRWIPNVVGQPFALDTAYVRLVQQVTGSQPLLDLLRRIGGDT